jgi:co-chaperonin GroES (HSP10)
MIQDAPSGRSARLSHDGSTYIPAGARIRCLRDHIIVEPLDVAHSKVLEVIEHIKPVRGVIKAVGPGHYPKRYDHPDKHRRSKMWDSKVFQPTEVKVGDVVELGGIEFGGYSFQTFLWGDKTHLICREADVSGVELNEPQAQAK